MKKRLFVILAILLLGIVKVSADAAPPAFSTRNDVIEVKLRSGVSLTDADSVIKKITKLEDVSEVTYSITEKNNSIIVHISNPYGFEYVESQIGMMEEVAEAKITQNTYESIDCECNSNYNGLSDKDIDKLRITTYIIYATLGILVILMIVVICLLIFKKKNNRKKDA